MTGSVIRGRILDGGSWPVVDAAVSLSPLSHDVSVPDIVQLSDNEGRYLWTDLDEGGYEVMVRMDGYHPASARTYVPAGTQVRVDFHLTPGPTRAPAFDPPTRNQP